MLVNVRNVYDLLSLTHDEMVLLDAGLTELASVSGQGLKERAKAMQTQLREVLDK